MRCRKTVLTLRWKLLKIRLKEIYMKYVKIIIWAIIEIIAELYNKKSGKG
ncbi:MAG: hypothetical protein IJ037_09895 [Clostridia bacterium]|nr:hypothetical protein [Clostridia bacterium]MBQ8369548.1 hypothetical protein [Clostridia bacterium]